MGHGGTATKRSRRRMKPKPYKEAPSLLLEMVTSGSSSASGMKDTVAATILSDDEDASDSSENSALPEPITIGAYAKILAGDPLHLLHTQSTRRVPASVRSNPEDPSLQTTSAQTEIVERVSCSQASDIDQASNLPSSFSVTSTPILPQEALSSFTSPSPQSQLPSPSSSLAFADALDHVVQPSASSSQQSLLLS
ncbi:hypothetical protein A4X09_0g6916 [Tilletia walkeri]|uniref:Uncharacterized protein n=1 Tax=Tilletia walkeri TaxID=117179 RepID=A0A8X7N1W6_9BASI|nr:hypothetical protein A4X09_0g6916 [Tilletia walkeri]